jgi:hypothetical protein
MYSRSAIMLSVILTFLVGMLRAACLGADAVNDSPALTPAAFNEAEANVEAIRYLELTGVYLISDNEVDLVVDRIIKPLTTMANVDFEAIRKSLCDLSRTTERRILLPLIPQHFPPSILKSVNDFLQTPEGQAYRHALIVLYSDLFRQENMIRRDLYEEVAHDQPGSPYVPVRQDVPAPVRDVEKAALVARCLELHKDYDRFTAFYIGGLLRHFSIEGHASASVAALKEKYHDKYTDLVVRILAPTLTVPVLNSVNAYLVTEMGKKYVDCLVEAESDLRMGQEKVGQIIGPITREKIAEFVPQPVKEPSKDGAKEPPGKNVSNF